MLDSTREKYAERKILGTELKNERMRLKRKRKKTKKKNKTNKEKF
jgi:hypothetical protein